jgi:hypothetical protein
MDAAAAFRKDGDAAGNVIKDILQGRVWVYRHRHTQYLRFRT